VLDGSGHLVGIVTAKLDAAFAIRVTGDIPQNVNFALKAEVVRTFLDSTGIAYHSAPSETSGFFGSDKQLSPADVGDIARPFTLRIECEPISTQVALPAAPIAPAPAAAPNAPAPPSQAAAPPSHPTTPDDICRALEQDAAENELPVEFFARVIWQESRFNARKGAPQFIEALKNSARYLRDLKARFGNIGLAAAAYHAGPERVAIQAVFLGMPRNEKLVDCARLIQIYCLETSR
jgi:hypothetical protein